MKMSDALKEAAEIIGAALQCGSDMCYEAYPSRRWCRANDLPRGYCGAAYYASEPGCVQAIADDLVAGWHLETAEDIVDCHGHLGMRR